MPHTDRIYHLDNTDVLRRHLPEVRKPEFRMLLEIYRTGGYETAKKFLDNIKKYETEKKIQNRTVPYSKNKQKIKREKSIKQAKPQPKKLKEDRELTGLDQLDYAQQKTALQMRKDYGYSVSQNYINNCLKICA